MSTVNASEIKKFTDLSATWWNYEGTFKQLHKMNRVRITYIKDILQQQGWTQDHSLKNLQILDIGCGGGILSVALSRLGANVVGIDAASDNILAAKNYAHEKELSVHYLKSTAEDLVAQNSSYDIVCALEIVEHVADLELFLKSTEKLVKKDGLIFISTINKTFKSCLAGIFLAEYILRMVPIGTHNWHNFVTPSKIVMNLKNCQLIDMKGMKFKPLLGNWQLDANVDVNYIMALKK